MISTISDNYLFTNANVLWNVAQMRSFHTAYIIVAYSTLVLECILHAKEMTQYFLDLEINSITNNNFKCVLQILGWIEQRLLCANQWRSGPLTDALHPNNNARVSRFVPWKENVIVTKFSSWHFHFIIITTCLSKCINKSKQLTTKPFAYFMGYTA